MTPFLPKTLAVIGHPLLFYTGFHCFLESVLRVRQLCGPSLSCPLSSQPLCQEAFWARLQVWVIVG